MILLQFIDSKRTYDYMGFTKFDNLITVPHKVILTKIKKYQKSNPIQIKLLLKKS